MDSSPTNDEAVSL